MQNLQMSGNTIKRSYDDELGPSSAPTQPGGAKKPKTECENIVVALENVYPDQRDTDKDKNNCGPSTGCPVAMPLYDDHLTLALGESPFGRTLHSSRHSWRANAPVGRLWPTERLGNGIIMPMGLYYNGPALHRGRHSTGDGCGNASV